MNLEDRQQQLTRWIDGELEGEALRAFEAAAAEDPLLLEAKVEADHLRQMLQSDMPAREIPNPEFFNSQIQRRIADDLPAPTPSPASSSPTGGGIMSWFRSPFTLASAAAVVGLGLFALSHAPDPGGSANADHTSVASTYTPDRQIDASHFYSDEADATVIMLDGLAALPDSTELKGQNIVSADQGSPNELYNEDRELAFVIIQGADSAPIIRSF